LPPFVQSTACTELESYVVKARASFEGIIPNPEPVKSDSLANG